MIQRFFRTSDDSVYEQARGILDSAWKHVPPVTCIDPAAVAPRDSSGRIVLAVNQEFTQFSVAVDLLPTLIASGVVEEIDLSAYLTAIDRKIA
jgi:hypothetical protein